MIAGMITNGYLLTADRIQRLNRAGLDHLQISDRQRDARRGLEEVLKVLDKKLQLLAEHADFHVNINSVVGGGIHNPHDALVVGRRAVELGFTSTIGIIHDGDGQLRPLGETEREVFLEDEGHWRSGTMRASTGSRTTSPMASPTIGGAAPGARYLYICEDGLVHYCSQQRGIPGMPLEQYTVDDIRREFLTEKGCAPHCTVSCVHHVSYMDHLASAADHP